MEPAVNDVEIIEKNFLECRKIEKAWEGYLNIENNLKMGDVLAYHWKIKSDNNEKIGEFGILVKATGIKSNFRKVLFYLFVILAIDIFNGIIISILSSFWVFIKDFF